MNMLDGIVWFDVASVVVVLVGVIYFGIYWALKERNNNEKD